MCAPVLAAAAIVMTLYSGAQEAKAQKEAGKSNQAIAENNAKLTDAQSHDALMLGAQEQERSAMKTRAVAGSQRAAIAANGLDSGVGTPSDLQDETALYGAVDRQNIALDSARKAWGYQADSTNFRNQGAQARWAGNTAAKVTYLKSFTSALGQGAALSASMGGGK